MLLREGPASLSGAEGLLHEFSEGDDRCKFDEELFSSFLGSVVVFGIQTLNIFTCVNIKYSLFLSFRFGPQPDNPDC